MTMDAIDYLKLLADETRLRSLILLRREGELCVCELTHALGLSQPKISRHLSALRSAGIVQSRREGVWMYYSTHEDLPGWALNILDASLDGVANMEPFISDHQSLCGMPNRPGATCCA